MQDVLDHFQHKIKPLDSNPVNDTKSNDKKDINTKMEQGDSDAMADNNSINDTLSVDEGHDSDFNDAENDEYEVDIKDKKKNSKDNVNNNNLKTEVEIKTEHILRQSRKDGITKEYLD